jgi:hypothetical protein
VRDRKRERERGSPTMRRTHRKNERRRFEVVHHGAVVGQARDLAACLVWFAVPP